MKFFSKIVRFCGIFTLLMVLLAACTSPQHRVHRLESVLASEQVRAEEQTDRLVAHLSGDNPSFDSIWTLTHSESSCLFYIFRGREMLYWSDNWLVTDQILLLADDVWWYSSCRNAHVLGRWTSAGDLRVLTVLPVKYDFPESELHLRNDFVPPFRGDDRWQLSRSRDEASLAVHGKDGSVLFYVTPSEETEAHSVQSEEGSWRVHARVRVYFILFWLLLVGLLAWMVYLLIRRHGFANMPIRYKFLFLVIALLVFFFLYVFSMSVRLVGDRYEMQQKEELTRKCDYVASSLSSIFFWDLYLTMANTPALNLDLQDMSKVFNTDINVYNLQGDLVGTSSPDWFDEGLLSVHMSPALLFSSDTLSMRKEHIGRRSYLAAYAMFYNGSGVPLGYVATPSLISGRDKHLQIDHFTAHLLPPCLLALVLAIMFCYALSRWITLPLSRLSDSFSHFRLGVRTQHIEYKGHDEVGELVQHYNQLLDQLQEATSRMAQSERESAWRTMARQIAHEINNPLTPMRLRIQQLRRLRQEEDERFDQYFRETTTMLIEQIDNLSHIASSFSTFAKLPEVTTAEVDVARLLSSVICLFQTNPENIPVRYVGPDSGIMAMADPQQLPEVFTNIIKNALQALEGKKDGDVIVRLDAAGGISISDNGPGIPEEYRERVFLPNFTTKSTGTGLGLAISKNIVEQSGGTISFETSERGTTFYIYLKQSI